MFAITIQIAKLVNGGRGLGRDAEGRVVFVRGALPGETVRAAVTRAKRDYLEAEALEVLEASPARVTPPCPHYGICGGCDLMHLAQVEQGPAKAAWVDEMLGRLPGMPRAKLVPSPAMLAWRNRVRFQLRPGGAGFFERGGRRVVPLVACPVADDAVSGLLPGLNRVMAVDTAPDLRWAEAVAAPGQPLLLTLGLGRGIASKDARALARGLGADHVRLAEGRDLEPMTLAADNAVRSLALDGLDLRTWAGLFCQVNFGVNAKLVEVVRAAAGPLGRGRALDLYAGTGNLSLPLALDGWRVLAVEAQAEAVGALRWQAHGAGLAGAVEGRTLDAGRALDELTAAGERFDMVVLDPPRAGAKGLMPAVAALGPQRVVYVSCHPAVLARDAAALVKAGYRPVELHALDMFPQTSHVEAALVLERA